MALRSNPKICEAYFSKWTTSGEPPDGSRSHWDLYFRSNKQLFWIVISKHPVSIRFEIDEDVISVSSF